MVFKFTILLNCEIKPDYTTIFPVESAWLEVGCQRKICASFVETDQADSEKEVK